MVFLTDGDDEKVLLENVHILGPLGHLKVSPRGSVWGAVLIIGQHDEEECVEHVDPDNNKTQDNF